MLDKELLGKISALTSEEERILSGELIDKALYADDGAFTVNDARVMERGKDISLRTHTRFVDFPEHKHNYLELMLLLEGQITHLIAGERITLRRGDVLVLNKHVAHSIERADTPDVGVNVIISDSFVNSLAPELENTVFSELATENAKTAGAGMYIAFSTEGDPRIENVTENILFELTSGAQDASIIRKTVALLFDLLSRGSDKLLKAASRLPDEKSLRKKAISKYVRHNFKTGSLRALAGSMYLSEPYLSKLIKGYFGKSFKELLLEERIRRAEELLSATDVSISDVIRNVGYENESYFHRAFRKHTGKSMLAYRKSAAAK